MSDQLDPGIETAEVFKDADVSECGTYRYNLTRRWDDRPLLGWVTLNPSTADASMDDATIRRLAGTEKRPDVPADRLPEYCDERELLQ